jgi:stearoyl-CoA desaturase (delta-9 desaturase)
MLAVLGGLVYASILRIFFVHQATFCVNSIAHWLGDQPFDDRDSPRDHAVTAFLTLGEGYHNFHHQFPSDYRNAIGLHQYDPTKWSIWIWKQLGLAHDLKTFRWNEIEKGRIEQDQKKLNWRKAQLEWPKALEVLPVIDWTEFRRQIDHGDSLIIIAGVIHEVRDFVKDHPGGQAMIRGGIGKDATAMFNGGVYNRMSPILSRLLDPLDSHRDVDSKAAQNLLSTLRVGVMRGGCEVDIWKQNH